MQIKNIVFVLAAFVLSGNVLAQETSDKEERNKSKEQKRAERRAEINELIKKEEAGAIIYNKYSIFGGKLYNDGWGLLYEHGKLKNSEVNNFWTVEIGERKHPKEEKLRSNSSAFFFGNPLIYGKQNNFFFVRGGFGQQRLIGGKGVRHGVSVSLLYGGGVSLGLLKPYYVEVVDPLTTELTAIKWQGNDSRTDTLFLDPGSLIGGSSVFKGFGEMSFNPGVYAKTGVRFDYGRYNELVSAIEVGISGDFYFSKMPIVLLNEPKQFFGNVYVALEFGRRK